MKALVTGGAGFIGSHLVEALLARDWSVSILDDFSTGAASVVSPAASVFRGDVADAALAARAVKGCTTVFHLAAVSSVQEAMDRPLEVHRANLTGTLTLLEAASAAHVRRFVFASSAAVYGDTGGIPAREDAAAAPLGPYAVQKLASEHYCRAFSRLRGLETVCLRYFNIYGPRQRADSPYSGVIAKFLDAARRGEASVIHGDGGQTRDFCHVDDVIAANLSAALSPAAGVSGGVFNIGTGHSLSVLDLAGLVGRLFPGCPVPRHEAARAGEIRRSCADIGLAKARLDWQPVTKFEEGLAALARGVGV